MGEMNRREMGAALAAFAMMTAQTVNAQSDAVQSGAAQRGAAQSGEAAPAGETDLSVSRVFKFSEMKVSPSANGGWSRAIGRGVLPTGEFVEAHQTLLPPGQMPHLPHRHRNSEFIMIREGQIEYYNEGKPEPVGPGDVIYSASDKLHGMKNVGSTPALYFVVSVSRGQA